MRKRHFLLHTSYFILLFCAGCGPSPDSKELRQKVLKADPAFAKTLEQRDEVSAKMALLNRELALKKSQIERQIRQLRDELAHVTAQVKQKTAQTKALLTPEQARVDLAVSMAAEELKAKRNQRASLGRSISRLRKALNEHPQWSADERARMDRELGELTRETQRLDRELDTLTAHLDFLKDKRILLRV